MITIGIDPSLTSTGIVVLKNGEFFMSVNLTCPQPRKGAMQRNFRVKAVGQDDFKSGVIASYTFGTNHDHTNQIVAYKEAMSAIFDNLFHVFGVPDAHVGIEIPMATSKGKGMMSPIVFAVSCLVIRQYSADILSVREFMPGQIKKHCTGNGRAKKELMILGAYKKWGFEAENNDIVDAMAAAKLVHSEVTT